MNMKHFVLPACVCIVAAGIIAGCDSEPAGSPITISPPSATIHKGESITFTASGGYEYEWSVDTPEYGTLSVTRGASTVYTSIYDPTPEGTTNTTDVSVTQTLRVRSYITGDSSSASNGASSTESTATASIIHK
jgi:hypothetical protein